ncbi:MFS transporter [Desulfonema magnum]|uniref:MFS domain-containing protein n=1 Tax=Desulfonema magnum TaxID=45655 RepID=A0A975BW37_9BACT|nr:MFS transporter [Desulfonema magnum]QTA92567.1 MFS domain-containing protein [Desulfonema magnum]
MDNVKTALAPDSSVLLNTMYKMGLLFLMYIVQKIFLCFSWALLPIILRNQGASLGTIGFTTLVYSPWALKFLYASVVDRFYSIRMGRRKSWISPLLIISGIILPFLAKLSPTEDLELLLISVFVLNLIFATTDIAVDGYATDILEPSERPWGNAVQMAGYVIGYMLGAGLFLILCKNEGWSHTLLIISGLQMMLMIPILLHKEISPVFRGKKGASLSEGIWSGPSSWEFITRPGTLWFFLFSTLIAVFERGGSLLRVPMFVDMGFDQASLGQMNMWVGSPMTILGSVIGGILFNRMGPRWVFITGCLGGASLNFLSAIVFQNQMPGLWQIGIIMGYDKLVAGVIFIMIYSMIMSLSAGNQSATNYAVLCSATHLVGLGIMPISGNLCDLTGYFNLYMGLGFFGILVIFAGDYILRCRLAEFFQLTKKEQGRAI